MKLPAILAPIAHAFRAAALSLTKVDVSRPGLTGDNFDEIVGWVVNIDRSELESAAKATWVVDKVLNWFGTALPNWPWIPYAVVWAAHQFAKRRNLLAKKSTPTPA